MVRFKLTNERYWSRFDEDRIFICVDFDKATNDSITKKLIDEPGITSGCDDINALRACDAGLEYNKYDDTLIICEICLKEIDIEDGESYSRPFTNEDFPKIVNFEFNQDEINFIKEHLAEIEAQIDENEKNPVHTEIYDWEEDYLR